MRTGGVDSLSPLIETGRMTNHDFLDKAHADQCADCWEDGAESYQQWRSEGAPGTFEGWVLGLRSMDATVDGDPVGDHYRAFLSAAVDYNDQVAVFIWWHNLKPMPDL